MTDGWFSRGGEIQGRPAVVSSRPGRLDVFARGYDDRLKHQWMDHGLDTGHLDTGQWGTWEDLGGTLTGDPVAVSWGPGRLDVFARHTDNAVHHFWFSGNTPGHWEDIGGERTGDEPAVVSWGEGRIDIFAAGSPDGHGPLWHTFFNGNQLGDWENLGGDVLHSPSAVCWGDGRIDVLTLDTRGAVSRLPYEAGWGSWEPLAHHDDLVRPVACTRGPGSIDVIADANGSLLHNRYDGRRWAGWTGLDTHPRNPVPISRAVGQLDLFTESNRSDGRSTVWHLRWDGRYHPPEYRHGDLVRFSLAATSWGPGRVDLFGIGPDRTLQHKWFDDGAWSLG